MKQAVLFDLDGTLLDTLEDLADSMNAVLREQNLPDHPLDFYRTAVGDGVRKLAERALPAGWRDGSLVERCVERMRDVYGARWAEKTAPYDGVDPLLDALLAEGVACCILSNKPDDFTRRVVEAFFPGRPFRAVRGAREDVPLKPDPAAARAIVNDLGLPPDQWAYVGDTNTDMKTARAAGLWAIGALWGFRTAEELKASGAQVLAEHPADLAPLILEG